MFFESSRMQSASIEQCAEVFLPYRGTLGTEAQFFFLFVWTPEMSLSNTTRVRILCHDSRYFCRSKEEKKKQQEKCTFQLINHSVSLDSGRNSRAILTFSFSHNRNSHIVTLFNLSAHPSQHLHNAKIQSNLPVSLSGLKNSVKTHFLNLLQNGGPFIREPPPSSHLQT